MENSSKKKILIIGGGVSGLSAGIYGQKNGFETEIFEKLPTTGGLCTSWERKGIKIDGCIHWLTGTLPGSELYNMWHDVNAFKDEDIIHSDNFGSIEYKGKTFTLWCDLEKFRQEMLEISPQDKRRINKTIKLIKRFYKMPLPMNRPLSTNNIFSFIKIGLKLLPYVPAYLYASARSQKGYASKFKSEELRYYLSNIVPGDGNLYSTLYAFGTPAMRNGGVPKGGSRALTLNMEKEYLDNGGIIHTNSEVEEIIVEKKKVVGLKLKNGEIATGDYYVSSCDAYEVNKKLLKGAIKDKKIFSRFKNPENYPTPSCAYVSYKVKLDELKKLGLTSTFQFPCEPFNCGRQIKKDIKIRDYSYDETFVNEGYTLVNVLVHQHDKDYYCWENLRKDIKKYNEEKIRLANDIKSRIITRFPSLDGAIETIDVCTPMTYKRYVNAHRGAYMCWSYTHNGRHLIHNSALGGIKNFIFSGQWTMMPGGLPIALMSGKFAIQWCLKKEHLSLLINRKK